MSSPREQRLALWSAKDRKLWAKALALWLAMLVIAIAAGGLREALLAPALTERLAHQIGTVVVCLVFGFLAYRFARSSVASTREAIRVGSLWSLLTLAFEFGFFHFAMNKPWSELLADYNVTAGRLWPLVLLTLLLTPYLTVRMRHSTEREASREVD